VLKERIAHGLTRPVGRPSQTRIKRFYEDFQYQAASWGKPRRIIAKMNGTWTSYSLASASSSPTCP